MQLAVQHIAAKEASRREYARHEQTQLDLERDNAILLETGVATNKDIQEASSVQRLREQQLRNDQEAEAHTLQLTEKLRYTERSSWSLNR